MQTISKEDVLYAELTGHYKCKCGAQAKNTSKERGRFLRRHFENCVKSSPHSIPSIKSYESMNLESSEDRLKSR